MKTQQTLNIIFYTSIVLSLLAVVLFETNTLIGGWWADNRSADFLCTTFLELFSLCAIPVAFRLVRPSRSNTARMNYDRRAILRLVAQHLCLLRLHGRALWLHGHHPFSLLTLRSTHPKTLRARES